MKTVDLRVRQENTKIRTIRYKGPTNDSRFETNFQPPAVCLDFDSCHPDHIRSYKSQDLANSGGLRWSPLYHDASGL